MNMILRRKTVCLATWKLNNASAEQLLDYRAFQELLMGPDVRLNLQVPIQLITSKRYEEGRLVRHSELQYLRLWQYGRSQYLMFFANVSSNMYKEYKSTSISRIRVLIRLRSKAKDP